MNTLGDAEENLTLQVQVPDTTQLLSCDPFGNHDAECSQVSEDSHAFSLQWKIESIHSSTPSGMCYLHHLLRFLGYLVFLYLTPCLFMRTDTYICMHNNPPR